MSERELDWHSRKKEDNDTWPYTNEATTDWWFGVSLVFRISSLWYMVCDSFLSSHRQWFLFSVALKICLCCISLLLCAYTLPTFPKRHSFHYPHRTLCALFTCVPLEDLLHNAPTHTAAYRFHGCYYILSKNNNLVLTIPKCKSKCLNDALIKYRCVWSSPN